MPPTLNDLRNLALLLPPNLKLAAGEAADVVSGIAAYLEHGEPLIEAAGNGAQAVADFFHQHIVDTAPEGAPPVVKGNPVETVQHKPGPAAGGVSQTDLANFKRELMGDIHGLLRDLIGGGASSQDPPAPAGEPPASPPTPAPGDPEQNTAGDDTGAA